MTKITLSFFTFVVYGDDSGVEMMSMLKVLEILMLEIMLILMLMLMLRFVLIMLKLML